MTADLEDFDFTSVLSKPTKRVGQSLNGRRAQEKKRLSKSDRRKLSTTGRTVQMNLKTRAEWRVAVAAYAKQHDILMIEAIERAWAALMEKEGRR